MQFALYEHRQTSVWPTLFAAVVLVAFIALIRFLVPLSEWVIVLIVGFAALCLAVFAAFLGSMTVRIIDGQLRWSYGIVGWPRWSLPLERVAGVETTRTRLFEGWGVHRTRRGWLYNLAGLDAVLIRRVDGSSFLLGTDEPQLLALALESARTDARRRSRIRRR